LTVRRRSILALAIAAVLVPSPAAIASLPPVDVRVSPAQGGPEETFVLSFLAPTTTGTIGSTRVRDVLSASNDPGSASCLRSVSVPIAKHRGRQRMRLRLNPRNLGGRWCPGVYHGQIAEFQQPICQRGKACPAYVIRRGAIARFALHVRGQPSGRGGDVTAPRFAGLQRAFACTPGPQRPGQTTPYSLTWQAASDDTTPPSQIVYDVFYAPTSRGEDLSRPNWTTAPGVTSFQTPALASHASAYFVVRARDATGNEDANTIERAGVDPCY
jgi:hypothetical protein